MVAVYVTTHGTVYHRNPTCHFIKKKGVQTESEMAVFKKGLPPCKYCSQGTHFLSLRHHIRSLDMGIQIEVLNGIGDFLTLYRRGYEPVHIDDTCDPHAKYWSILSEDTPIPERCSKCVKRAEDCPLSCISHQILAFRWCVSVSTVRDEVRAALLQYVQPNLDWRYIRLLQNAFRTVNVKSFPFTSFTILKPELKDMIPCLLPVFVLPTVLHRHAKFSYTTKYKKSLKHLLVIGRTVFIKAFIVHDPQWDIELYSGYSSVPEFDSMSYASSLNICAGSYEDLIGGRTKMCSHFRTMCLKERSCWVEGLTDRNISDNLILIGWGLIGGYISMGKGFRNRGIREKLSHLMTSSHLFDSRVTETRYRYHRTSWPPKHTEIVHTEDSCSSRGILIHGWLALSFWLAGSLGLLVALGSWGKLWKHQNPTASSEKQRKAGPTVWEPLSLSLFVVVPFVLYYITLHCNEESRIPWSIATTFLCVFCLFHNTQDRLHTFGQFVYLSLYGVVFYVSIESIFSSTPSFSNFANFLVAISGSVGWDGLNLPLRSAFALAFAFIGHILKFCSTEKCHTTFECMNGDCTCGWKAKGKHTDQRDEPMNSENVAEPKTISKNTDGRRFQSEVLEFSGVENGSGGDSDVSGDEIISIKL